MGGQLIASAAMIDDVLSLIAVASCEAFGFLLILLRCVHDLAVCDLEVQAGRDLLEIQEEEECDS